MGFERKAKSGQAFIVAKNGRNQLGERFKTKAGATRAKDDIVFSMRRLAEKQGRKFTPPGFSVKKIKSSFFTKTA